MKRENVTRPRVTLSFELTRSGLVQLNKAEAKVEETYFVDPPKPSKTKNTTNTSSDADDTTSQDDSANGSK